MEESSVLLRRTFVPCTPKPPRYESALVVSTTAGLPPKQELAQSDWPVGWKLANLYIGSDARTLYFMPLHQDGIVCAYAVSDTAECQQYSHEAPHDACRCGFNAWPDLRVVRQYQQNIQRQSPSVPRSLRVVSPVLMRVGLYGEFVEGFQSISPNWRPWGYRASQQRVSDLFFEKRCATCAGQALDLGFEDNIRSWGWPLRPLCPAHLDRTHATISSDGLAAHNDITIHWGYPSE